MNRANKLGLGMFLSVITMQLFWEKIDTLPKSIVIFVFLVIALLAITYGGKDNP